MFFQIVFLVGILGQMSSGIPLQNPRSELSQYFDNRIVGGENAPKGSAPYMAALIVGHVYKSLTCGGSIIGTKYIITAAHCIASFITWDGLLDSFHVTVGSNEWIHGTELRVVDHVIHPNYDAWFLKNDIGVLTTENIPFNQHVSKIGVHMGWVDGGERGVVTGWGTQQPWGVAASYLQMLHVNILSGQECEETVAQLGGGAPPVDSRQEICTIHSPGHGMCHGDSGSGLILLRVFELIGIVSWGFPCAIGAPDMFCRVSAFDEFLKPYLS